MDYLILTTLNGLIFVAWVVMMFRTLFGHRRRSAARTGRAFPGVAETVKEWCYWWHSPAQKTERRVLIILTLALLGTLALMVVRAPSG